MDDFKNWLEDLEIQTLTDELKEAILERAKEPTEWMIKTVKIED